MDWYHPAYTKAFEDSFPLWMAFLLWTFIWKGMALWVTARRGQQVWFVIFLVINTAGIAEIIYLIATKGFSELNTKK